MTNLEKGKIDAAVVNYHNMKCDLKGAVNMNLEGGEMFKLTKVLYVPQSVKDILSLQRIVSKGTTMGDNQDKITMKKNSVNMILDARQGNN